MHKETVKLLTTGKGIKYGHVGLVDAKGVFVLLVSSDESEYFEFSDESDVIATFAAERKTLNAEVAKLEKQLKKQQADYHEELNDLEKRFKKLSRIAVNLAQKTAKKADRTRAIDSLLTLGVDIHAT